MSKALEGEEVGEMWAMQESKRINDIHASMKSGGSQVDKP